MKVKTALTAPEVMSSTSIMPLLACAEPVAIVSVACRLPGHISNPHQFWEFLLAGRVATSDSVPESRYNVDGHFDGSGRPGTLKTVGGMFIEDIDLGAFDASFFHTSRSDAAAMDPQQRQLLEVVYECLENGGITLEKIDGDEIGCFVASYAADWHEMQSRNPAMRAPGTSAGISRAILSNRISHFLNIKGSSWTIDTACSGGLVGVDAACEYLRAGKINGAIVAAAQLWMSPEYNQELGTMRAAFSPTGRCHSFDAKADGYCRAEAVNAVYLKRLSDALRDGDPVRAVIRGTANNSDGRTPGLHSPNAEAQAAAIRAAYADAGISGMHYATTAFMECHATGTPAGDPSEVRGAASVLTRMRAPTDPLIIGTIKSNLGHAEPAAGISGLMKAMMAVERGTIPGNPTFITPNPAIDFEALRVRASRRSLRWPKSSNSYRRASVASSGFGGSNAHVILDNADHYAGQTNPQAQMPSRTYVTSYADSSDVLSLLASSDRAFGCRSEAPTPRPQVLVFSANDADSLSRQIDALSNHLVDPRVAVQLSDLSYTLSERRSRHLHRAFVVACPKKGGRIETLPIASAKRAKKPATPVRVGFVFTGQGAQWPQMGADLLRMFPGTAETVVRQLDAVLQELPTSERPSWSLLHELTQPRSSEHLRKPEFSQPLVTALQLAMLAVLESWGVEPDVVVGHSSGEIAAAASAGLLTPAQAILTAYFRGCAAKEAGMEASMGMLAVGLGSSGVQKYLDQLPQASEIVIACYNSPASVTLSGPTPLLSKLTEAIQKDGHFARLLQVDMPYHSHYMSAIGDKYEDLLVKHGRFGQVHHSTRVGKTRMVSSVHTGLLAGYEVCHAAYWKTNMVSAVKFDGACTRMIQDQDLAASLLIEIGPSAALGGPIGQIINQVEVDGVTYTSAMKRGNDALHALFGVAGQLFLHDCPVALPRVNADESGKAGSNPAVIIDLPNYKWNHSTKFWHESLASRDWRFKKFPEHDLLGSKILGTPWESPCWTKELRLEDVPWLRDHKIGSEILFPASGYIAMAVEAARQAAMSIAISHNKPSPTSQLHHYELQNVVFERALVLEDEVDLTLMLSLSQATRLGVSWWAFTILSLPRGTSPNSSASCIEHSNGFVRLVTGASKPLLRATGDYNLPLQDASPARHWYKAFQDVGYAYGSAFQRQTQIECTEGNTSARTVILLDSPPSKWEPQPHYPLHPVSVEACFQATLTSLHRGTTAGIQTVFLPSGIDRLVLSGNTGRSNEAVAITTADSSSSHRKRPLCHASLYDPKNGDLMMELKGLSMASIELQGITRPSPTYVRMEWRLDLSLLDNDTKMRKAMGSCANGSELCVQHVLDLAAHKTPNLKVLEIDLTYDEPKSLWLSGSAANRALRVAAQEFTYASDRPESVLSAQDAYSHEQTTHATRFALVPITSPTFVAPSELSISDLVLLRTTQLPSETEARTLAVNARRLLCQGGTMVLQISNNTKDMDAKQQMWREALSHGRFIKVRQAADGLLVAEAASVDGPRVHDTSIVVLHISASTVSPWSAAAICLLKSMGWAITELSLEPNCTLTRLPANTTILVMDEVDQPIFANMTRAQLQLIQQVIQPGCHLFWITQGSQMHVSSPTKAICHGVFRSARAEKANAQIVTMDVESAAIEHLPSTVELVHTVLLQSKMDHAFSPGDVEFAERDGLVYISRLRPSHDASWLQGNDDVNELKPVASRFHSPATTIGLGIQCPGKLDTLCFAKLEAGNSLQLAPEQVEVEVFSSLVDADDYAVAMGADLKDPIGLGNGGAGVVARVGHSIADLRVGQRVAVFHASCLANRVVVSRNVVFPIPDAMTFEDAASLPAAFVTAIHSIRYLAQLRQGQRVLIHSAANAIGTACIQLCRLLSCEPYVTVGTKEELEFLERDMDVPPDHGFLSISDTFLPDLHQLTQTDGIDIILNLSSGRLPEQMWELLSRGGTHIEICGGNSQPTSVPLDRLAENRSFCSLNIRTFPHEKLAAALDDLAELLRGCHIKSVLPKAIFSYNQIKTALQLLEDGNRLRSVVISNGSDPDVEVLVQPAKTQKGSLLASDKTYILVGELEGVLGSLALHLARRGAKHLVVMSGRDCKDSASERHARSIRSMGCSLLLLQGDASSMSDVRQCYSQVPAPIGGVVQGTTVFMEQTFTSLSYEAYATALIRNVQGTWNLHKALENEPIQFFAMLSSSPAFFGQAEQVLRAGIDAFHDALAMHRCELGLHSTTLHLGPINDDNLLLNSEQIYKGLSDGVWMGTNEAMFRQILDEFLSPHNHTSQVITGLALPQPPGSEYPRDLRLAGLRLAQVENALPPHAGGDSTQSRELQKFILCTRSAHPDHSVLLSSAVGVLQVQFTKMLRLGELMDPAYPLNTYGMDSLASAEPRSWVRTTFGVQLTTLDVVNAASLVALGQKIIDKMGLGKQP